MCRAVGAGFFSFALLLLVVPSVAVANHYFLEDVGFISEAEVAALNKEKITDTEELLKVILTPEARKRLAEKTAIAVEKINEWAKLCDLLRVKGVGPKMARLMLLAGVGGMAELRKQDAADLLRRLEETNRKEKVSEILPQVETIKDWIDQARKLDLLVQ